MLGQADTGPRVGPLMVKLRDPRQAARVAAELNAQGDGQWKAWTRQELADANAGAMFEEGILVIIIGGCVVLGTIIGVAITWQTLRGAIMANIKEFASLRALGVGMGSLRRIVMELSFWVGLVGVVAAIGLTLLVQMLAAANAVIIALPPVLLIIVGGGLIAHRHAVGPAVARHPQEQPARGSAAMTSRPRLHGKHGDARHRGQGPGQAVQVRQGLRRGAEGRRLRRHATAT